MATARFPASSCWQHYEDEFTEWIYDALAGQSQTDWLPEWNPMPHVLIELGPNAFGG